jgi:UDP-glucose:(heptosyl)LPS alpha-1,3-glucosyltransferase
VKIALIVEHADSSRGGAERYTVQLAAALASRGHRVTLIAREGAEPPNGVELVRLPARALVKTSRYARFLQMIDGHLRENSYGIVHAMMPVHQCDVYHPHAGLAAEAIERGHLKHGGGVRQSVSRVTNQLHLRRRYFRSVEKKLLGRDDGPVVLCVSNLVKNEVRQHYPLPEKRLAVLFNAVDLIRFDPEREPTAREKIRRKHGIAPDKIVALMVAQNFRLKGLAVAIDAAAILNDPRLMLLVVGKESPTPYERQAKKLGIENRIIFAGSTSDIYSYYAAADFFVLPTMRDSCSLVVLEALAMGVPVISTKTNGACEIMENGGHGFVLDDPQNAAALTQAMKQMMDEDFRQNCARASQQLRSRLAFEEHVEKLLAIYSQVTEVPNG